MHITEWIFPGRNKELKNNSNVHICIYYKSHSILGGSFIKTTLILSATLKIGSVPNLKIAKRDWKS